MKKSNYEIKIDESWESLQMVIKQAEEAYNKTTLILQELGMKGIKKVWIGTNEGLDFYVTKDSLYTTKENVDPSNFQHDILNKIGVGAGCSNGNGNVYQTQIYKDSLVYGIYELSEEGWIRIN